MTDVLYLAWRYLRFHWGTTSILVSAITLVLFLPAGLYVVVDQGAKKLTARADRTPLLLGVQGSAFDLTLSALYFRTPHLTPCEFREVRQLNQTGLAIGIPLHLRYSAREQRIVGTTMDYFEFRALTLAHGRWFALLGECVLGSEAARALGVKTGDRVLSSAGSAFDVAGATPLKMPVVGVLQPTGTADDQAVFVDVKTTWVIAGLAHGHDDVVSTQPADPSPSTQEQRSVVAQASVLPYTEITSTNRHSFHFHGEPDLFPIDAIVVVPTDYKSGILLRGRYEESHQNVQMVVPSRVVAEILETMFSVRDYVLLGSVGVAAATFLTVALVFGLSIRLRRREIETIQKIGGSSRHLAGILSLEILLVVLTGGFVASMLTLCVSQFGDILIHLVSR